jgi:hypothetical protein
VGERGSESSEGLPCNKLNSFFFHFSAPVLVMRAGASVKTGLVRWEGGSECLLR